MKKRFFALLLAAMMIVAALPTAAFAAEDISPRHPVYMCPDCDLELILVRTVDTYDPSHPTPCSHGDASDYPATKTQRWYCPQCGELVRKIIIARGVFCGLERKYYWY